MNQFLLVAVILLLGGIGPGLWLGARDGPVQRLFALEMVTAVGVVVLMLLAKAFGQTSYLIVPIVLAPLSFAGTLVFTRLLAPPSK